MTKDTDIYFQSPLGVTMTKSEWDEFMANATPIISKQLADSLDRVIRLNHFKPPVVRSLFND